MADKDGQDQRRVAYMSDLQLLGRLPQFRLQLLSVRRSLHPTTHHPTHRVHPHPHYWTTVTTNLRPPIVAAFNPTRNKENNKKHVGLVKAAAESGASNQEHLQLRVGAGLLGSRLLQGGRQSSRPLGLRILGTL